MMILKSGRTADLCTNGSKVQGTGAAGVERWYRGGEMGGGILREGGGPPVCSASQIAVGSPLFTLSRLGVPVTLSSS